MLYGVCSERAAEKVWQAKVSGGLCGVEGGTMTDFSALSRKKQPAVESGSSYFVWAFVHWDRMLGR